MIGITNASPMIYLGKIGAINLLLKIFDEIYTTSEIINEVIKKEMAPEKNVLEQFISTHVKVKNPQNQKLIKKIASLQIHIGEASIIVLAEQLSKKGKKNPILIIDDLAAREVAIAMNLPITGTIGIILRATKQNFITKKRAKYLIDQLVFKTNFHLSAKVYAKTINYLALIEP